MENPYRDKREHFTNRENDGGECLHRKPSAGLEKARAIYGDDYGGSKDEVSSPERAYGFADKERKNTAHHTAHAKEMGFKNQDEYEREACRFFNSNEGELYYSERRNRFYRYDEKKKRLVTSSGGVIHTFMLITKKKMEDKIKEDKLWKI